VHVVYIGLLPGYARHGRHSDNKNLRWHKYECIRTYQLDTKSNHNPNPATKQHAIANIQLNTDTYPTCTEKFIRDVWLHCLHYFRL